MGASEAVLIVVIVIVSIVATVVPLGLMGFVFYRIFKGGADRQKLLQTGIAATAHVQSVQQTGTYLNNQPEVHVQLVVQPPNGAAYPVATTMFLSLLDVPKLQPGMTVAVKIDSADPQKVAVDLTRAAGFVAPAAVAAMPGAMGFAPPESPGSAPAAAGFCRACGKPLAPGQAFCASCGARVG